MSGAPDIKEIIKQEYIKCFNDPVHFFRKYCHISHPHRGRILFHLYPFQEKVLGEFRQNDYLIITKSRQLGLSTLVAGYALWIMLFNKDKNILVLATKQDTAKNMVTKVKFMYDNLPAWLRGNKKPLEDSKLTLKLPNGSQIKAVSAASDAGRSEAVSLLIIDEAAHIDDIDTIYTSIKPTIATGGGCIALSSPNGIGNWFHLTWTKAQLGENDFVPINLPWQVHPERNEAWFAKEAINMSPRAIAQEYECDFLASGNTIVDPEVLKYYESTYIVDPLGKEGLGQELWVWEYPNYSTSYILTADVARGDGTDFSTFHLIDVTKCEQVAEFKGQLGTREFASIMLATAIRYNRALVVVENASMGWDVVMSLVESGYDNLYYSPKGSSDMDASKFISKIESDQTIPGFTNSTRTRPLVIGKLEAYIRERTFIFHSKRLLAELRTFIWENGKAQAANGYNDDLCLALGIGLYIRDTALKFYQYGMASTKANIESIQRPPNAVYNGAIRTGNPFMQNTGRGMEDISWVL